MKFVLQYDIFVFRRNFSHSTVNIYELNTKYYTCVCRFINNIWFAVILTFSSLSLLRTCPHMLRNIFGPPEVPLLALFQFDVIFIEVAHMMRFMRDSAQGNISHDESLFSST